MRTPDSHSRSGFTLLELLLVIAVMAILGSIILGGANYVTKVARVKRAQTTAKALEVALSRYRAEYNVWPKGGSEKKTGTVTFEEENNQKVFNMLRADNETDNENGIHFLDETSLLTVKEEDGEEVLVPYSDVAGGPLCFLSRNGTICYFKVKINLDDDTVEVSYPGVDDD